MKDKVNVRVLLTGLSLLGVFIAAAVVVVLMLAPRNDAPTFPERVCEKSWTCIRMEV